MSNVIHTSEHVAIINGVEGRMFNKVLNEETGLFLNQVWTASRKYKEPGYRSGSTITVAVRFDDSCRNNHQSFGITGDVKEPGSRDISKGGCIHDDIAKYFPELAHLIQWHLFDTRGPMHYPGNVTYHAGNRDHWGLVKGEASTSPKHQETRILFADSPISHKVKESFRAFIAEKLASDTIVFNIVPVEHEKKPGDTYNFKEKYTFDGLPCKWYECPFDTLAEAQEWQKALTDCKVEFVTVPTLFGEGKERDLKAARSCANWPEATDEQLSQPKADLERDLLARLPAMMEKFRADMDKSGMLWEQTPKTQHEA